MVLERSNRRQLGLVDFDIAWSKADLAKGRIEMAPPE
jgi:hypothetical protein